MKTKILGMLAVAVGLAAQFATAAPINLVQNGDFEATGAGPGIVASWSYSGGDSYFGVDADYIGSPLARPGQVFYDGAASTPGVLSQSIATTAGTAYVLEFDLQRYGNSGLPASNLASVTFGGINVFSEQDHASDWTHFVVSGLLGGPGAFSLLQFTNLNAFDFNQLDNVSLVAIQPVPEPGTLALLGLGLLGLGLSRRRS